MQIRVLTVSGSPKNISGETLHGRGVGGAELALITWAELLVKAGHEVRIYNQTETNQPIISNGVEYLPDNFFRPDEYSDILVSFRGPQQVALVSKYGKHIGWSCDQFTAGDYIDWYHNVDQMVLISEFHKQDHITRYGQALVESKAKVLDLGVRDWEYTIREKKPYQFIYCSIPDRGLEKVAVLWPRIKAQLPDSSLIITSDYTLWGASDPLNMQYKIMFAGMPGVKFVGNVVREQLVNYQSESEIQFYPCNYPENFCIANAECQVAGCFTITSATGALATTNFTGAHVYGDDNNYINAVTEFYNLPKEAQNGIMNNARAKAIQRFGWLTIAQKWNEIFNA